MPTPARWKDDPACGHEVAQTYQTHYCTYQRVPRLLTLQSESGDAEQRLLVLGLQAMELWLKVLRTDLQAAQALGEAGRLDTFEPFKLLHRSLEILSLLAHQNEVLEFLIAGAPGIGLAPQSEQMETVLGVAGELGRLADSRLAQGGPWRRFRDAASQVNARAARQKRWLEVFLSASPDAPKARYQETLHLPDLLSLQNGPRADWTPVGETPSVLACPDGITTDELMFLVVHQAFELWFKAILQELDGAMARMQGLSPDIPEAARRLRRVVTIQRLLLRQIQIPATMLPMDFLRFRDEARRENGRDYYRGLSPASGTESYQFREIEILAGLRDDPSFQAFLRGNDQLHIRFLTPAQERRLSQPTLPEVFERLAEEHGVRDLADLFTPASVANPHQDLAELGDLLLEFDQFFRLWRVNHVNMVERMIGNRSGTGFLGPEYLRETAGLGKQGPGRIFAEDQTRPRFFGRLFEARSRLVVY